MNNQLFYYYLKQGFVISFIAAVFFISGCSGYSSQTLYPDHVSSVRVEMFENQTFRRGMEYELSNAVAKRIEANTPYKIITSEDLADTVISGRIVSLGRRVLSLERQTGRALENDVIMVAVVNWKDLKTGQLLIDDQTIEARASYSEWQNQGFEYAYTLAANKLALRIVEQMEKKW